ncbi:MAG: bifunctional oligoribonuclease/PAP phosphatase NrnA [Candidatus Schekmanbacteria bacterium]|nr:bifunctional oligoribonuclease/PAP phosphatase NrnA [Candidatus Schekmanbacteria bacterium]
MRQVELAATASPALVAAAAALRSHCQVVITSHVNPDGDAIGSVLGLARALADAHYDVRAALQDPVPFRYRSLPDQDILCAAPLTASAAGLVVLLECPTFERAGNVLSLEQVRRAGATVLNVDHHSDNTRYGDIDFVDLSAAATGQLVLALLDELAVPVTPSVAANLYAAVLTDTGSFQHGNVTADVLRTAARLVDLGADPHALAREIYQVNPAGRLKLMAVVLQSLALSVDGKVASLLVTKEMLRECGAVPADTEDFANLARSVDGVQIGLLVRQTDGDASKISLRSYGDIDVQQVARVFGGGGHRNAAGATVAGSADSARLQVLDVLFHFFGFR